MILNPFAPLLFSVGCHCWPVRFGLSCKTEHAGQQESNALAGICLRLFQPVAASDVPVDKLLEVFVRVTKMASKV